ncbi:hypothetical protein RUM44_011085 [Polyplax serrata]|uniref:Uncharacterized protein n=1 Tax=Polyplax serrata TaxID=468196 RepID=A0ABR1AP62_POLSC
MHCPSAERVQSKKDSSSKKQPASDAKLNACFSHLKEYCLLLLLWNPSILLSTVKLNNLTVNFNDEILMNGPIDGGTSGEEGLRETSRCFSCLANHPVLVLSYGFDESKRVPNWRKNTGIVKLCKKLLPASVEGYVERNPLKEEKELKLDSPHG